MCILLPPFFRVLEGYGPFSLSIYCCSIVPVDALICNPLLQVTFLITLSRGIGALTYCCDSTYIDPGGFHVITTT